ncbi:MAG: serpin family protein [Dehalococcoidales bacterium]|nr:serpin family protein [Dehalococcoidales bacterium]
MKKIFRSWLYILLALSLVACSKPASADVIKSDKPRITSPAASQSDVAAVVAGNSAFAFQLYQQLKSEGGNLFYSPHSISIALAMAYAGASSQTEQQMADTLHYTLSQDRLHPAFNSLDIELSQRGQGSQGKDAKGFRLNVVNAIWGQKDYSFQPSYLDILAQNYGAGLRILDFINKTENSRITINDWVSDQTEGRIKDLVPQGAINGLTRLVLTNAIYFNAAWLHQFNKDATVNGPFNLIDGRQLTVPMMKQSETMSYVKGNDYQAVELLYDGQQISMVVLLPDAGKFQGFEQGLQAQQVGDIINNLKGARVNLTMPRFEFNSQFGLKNTLSEMGMPAAFTDNADFSGMTGKRDLHISDVLHKAFVSVDETGTEAAAATAVIVGVTSIPAEPPVEVTIDRPFIFIIRDIPTGEILFVGRVLNPSAQ